MYEIKSIGGKVLYTAKDANHVRAALEDAVRNGANLDGANLDGAYLRGAYLDGAYLDGAKWEKVATLLRESIAAMNDSGRHWIQGKLSFPLEDGTTAYCSVGSVRAKSDDGTIAAIALWLLGSVCAGGIESFNDDPDTTWEDVQQVFAIAIKHAERFARSQ